MAQINANSFQHVFIVDEDALASRVGRAASGRFIYSSEWQHATVLSEKLSELYQDRIAAVANLVGKKLVICDLDNTLWDGVIGEGDVSHFLERQKPLKALKDFGGVVLSIASKNDPANVHFRNSLLTSEDFVPLNQLGRESRCHFQNQEDAQSPDKAYGFYRRSPR